MSKKLTPWFPATVKPVHVGVYEVDGHHHKAAPWYSYWDGKEFSYRSSRSPRDALLNVRWGTVMDKRTTWRGLAEQPK